MSFNGMDQRQSHTPYIEAPSMIGKLKPIYKLWTLPPSLFAPRGQWGLHYNQMLITHASRNSYCVQQALPTESPIQNAPI